MASDTPAIGIDLGTTNSCVAVWRNGWAEVIPNELGNRSTPSYVAFSGEEFHVGEGAVNQAAFNPTNTIYDCKLLIGRRFGDPSVQEDKKTLPFEIIQGSGDRIMVGVKYKDVDKQIATELISSIVLAKMKEIAEAYLETQVSDAVITVPTHFNNSQRRATIDSGVIAGFKNIRIISESTAAAIGYGVEKMTGTTDTKNVVIFDLGSGTLDVSVATIGRGTIKVRAAAGHTHLGGNDFDRKMIDHLMAEFQGKHQLCISNSSKAMRKLRAACEKAKKVLSTNAQASIEIDSLIGDIDFQYTISRDKFEELNMDHFKSCIRIMENCLSDSKLDRRFIDEIILVGGSTRIPRLQQMLKDFFGKELCKSVNPDEIVACGAAIRAASGVQTSNNSSGQSLALKSVSEVNPFSIRIQAINDQHEYIIPKNTSISQAFKDVKFLSATAYNQPDLIINFWEHELGGNFLGQCSLPGSRRAGAGDFLHFAIDTNGILRVFVIDNLTGRNNWQIPVINNGSLTWEETERLIFELRKLKEEDEEYKKRAIAKNDLEDFLYRMSLFIKHDKIESVISPSEKEKIEEVVTKGTMWLDENCNKRTEAAEFEKKIKLLHDLLARTTEANRNHEDVLNPLVRKIFGRAPGEMSS